MGTEIFWELIQTVVHPVGINIRQCPQIRRLIPGWSGGILCDYSFLKKICMAVAAIFDLGP